MSDLITSDDTGRPVAITPVRMAGPQVTSTWSDTRALTSTTPAAARAAGATGIRNYVTSAQFTNSGASAVDAIILDGSTELWRGTIGPNGSISPVFPVPLRGTPATALNVNLSAAGTVRANVQGYFGP
jgi:hypothetical protein